MTFCVESVVRGMNAQRARFVLNSLNARTVLVREDVKQFTVRSLAARGVRAAAGTRVERKRPNVGHGARPSNAFDWSIHQTSTRAGMKTRRAQPRGLGAPGGALAFRTMLAAASVKSARLPHAVQL